MQTSLTHCLKRGVILDVVGCSFLVFGCRFWGLRCFFGILVASKLGLWWKNDIMLPFKMEGFFMLKWGLRCSFGALISVKNGCFLSYIVFMWLVVDVVIC